MNIAYLSSSRFPSKAANNVHVMKMCEAFSKAGHTVTLFCYRESDKSSTPMEDYGVAYPFNMNFIPLKGKNGKTMPLSKATAAYRMVEAVRAEDFDILYCRNIGAAVISLLNLHMPVIYEPHSFPPNIFRYILDWVLLSSKRLVQLVTITTALKEQYLSKYKQARGKRIIVAPDGANLPVPEAAPNPRGDCKVIGYVGHLYDGRGIDIIFSLAQRLPEARFLIVGGEDDHVARWKEKSGHLKNIVFQGYVPHANLGLYYPEMDILIAPYQSVIRVSGNQGDTSKWCSPLKIFEYMAQRRPMAVSNLPVFQEILESEKNCIICQADNVDSWQEQIQRLMADKPLRERLAETAYRDLKEKYTWDARTYSILRYLDVGKFEGIVG